MKKICSMLLLLCGYSYVFSQQSPVDTLVPKQHSDDTVSHEPKLQGGALIDTVNIKNNPMHQPGHLNDTLKIEKYPEKPKGKKY
jgi:hypothetical protein